MQNLLLRISFVLLLSGCATTPPNVPVCFETGMTRGFCTYTIENKDIVVDETRLLEGKTWWQMRPYMIHVPPSSWAEIKKFIVKICNKYPDQCQKDIGDWERKSNAIDKHVGGVD